MVDIREPTAAAKRDVRIQNDPERVAERIDEEVFHRNEADKVQAMIRDPVKQHFRNRKERGIWLEADEIMNRVQAQSIQSEFRSDQQGMEMLLGPRWKD